MVHCPGSLSQSVKCIKGEVSEVLVLKHRNGPIGGRRLSFVDHFAWFKDFNEAPS